MATKHENVITKDAPVSELAVPYLRHKNRLFELDFVKAKDVEVALYCLNANPSMVRELNVDDVRQLAVLKTWVQRDYSNYLLCIKHQVNHVALLTIYLDAKLQQTLVKSGDVSLIKSYDQKLIINYKYETKQGETISYFDKALGVPTTLTALANVKFKMINAMSLVEKIDVDVRLVDMTIVTNFITEALNRIVRDTILSVIVENNLTFYDLAQHYTKINQTVLQNLHAYFDACGLAAVDFSISDISIPNNTGKLLQNQFFAIAEAERLKRHEQKMEQTSLDLYERKAEIHSKYPDFPITLTEAEKDFALNRYLTRIGKDTALKADIQDKTLAARKAAIGGTKTEERKKIEPIKITKTSHKARIVYLVSMAILFLIAFCMFAVTTGAGLISLAAAVLIAGSVAIAKYKVLRYGSQTEEIINNDENKNSGIMDTAPVPIVAREATIENDLVE